MRVGSKAQSLRVIIVQSPVGERDEIPPPPLAAPLIDSKDLSNIQKNSQIERYAQRSWVAKPEQIITE